MAQLYAIGRCGVRSSPSYFHWETPPVPDDTWEQCLHMGRQDHEGNFLCDEHMAYWYCEECNVKLDRWGPYLACATCTKRHMAIQAALERQ